MRRDQAFRWETELEQVQAHLGLAIGFGLIGIGLTVLLVGLLWSGTRRLRNLPDDPPSLRVLIVVGLAISALGVVVGAIGAATS